jgi:mRNA interferase MazF
LQKTRKDGAPTLLVMTARSRHGAPGALSKQIQTARGATQPVQDDKKRPALVLTRNSAIAYLCTVTVAPVTSTIRDVPSELVLNEEDGMKSPCAVNLHNAVTVSQQRLGKRVAQLSSARMNEVCAALRFSLGCDAN